MHAQRHGAMYTLNLFQLLNQSPTSKYPPHLPLMRSNSLSRRTVTKTRTDGHTSPLQIIMHLIMRLERIEIFLWKNDQFLTRIIDYNISGGIATFLLPCRAAPAIRPFYPSPIQDLHLQGLIIQMSGGRLLLRESDYGPEHQTRAQGIQTVDRMELEKRETLKKNPKVPTFPTSIVSLASNRDRRTV